MSIPKLELAERRNDPVFEVYNSALIINVLDELGAKTGKAATISMAELVEDNDTHGLLLWGVFMQLDMLRKAVGQAQQAAASVRSPFDEEGLEERLEPVFKFVAGRLQKYGVIPKDVDIAGVLANLKGEAANGTG